MCCENLFEFELEDGMKAIFKKIVLRHFVKIRTEFAFFFDTSNRIFLSKSS